MSVTGVVPLSLPCDVALHLPCAAAWPWRRRSEPEAPVPGEAVVAVGLVAVVDEAGVIPEPNVGALPDLELGDPPAVSPRALEIGIWYCLPAGEPGSTWTPGELAAPASAGGAATARETPVRTNCEKSPHYVRE